MSHFQGLPPIVNIPPLPNPTPTLTQNLPNPPLETTPHIEQSQRLQSTPLIEQSSRQTQSTPQPGPQPSLHSHTTSQSGHDSAPITLGMASSSTMGSKIVLRPVGKRFQPYNKVARTIAKAIKSNFGEGYPSWKKVPEDRRKLWLEEFKKVYTWDKADNAQIIRNFEARGSNKYISITKAVRKKKTQPMWMGDLAYATLTAHWESEKYKELSGKATANRNVDSDASMHTSGAKPHVAIWEQMTAENEGVAPSMENFYMRTHKIHKGSKVGEWVSPQFQQRFENYSKLREEVLSNAMNGAEGTSQDDVTQTSDLAIFAQSVGGKKKGLVCGMGSLAGVLDDTFSTSAQTNRLRFDDPLITSMTQRIQELEQENQQLRQQQKESEARHRQELAVINANVAKILEHLKLPG